MMSCHSLICTFVFALKHFGKKFILLYVNARSKKSAYNLSKSPKPCLYSEWFISGLTQL